MDEPLRPMSVVERHFAAKSTGTRSDQIEVLLDLDTPIDADRWFDGFARACLGVPSLFAVPVGASSWRDLAPDERRIRRRRRPLGDGTVLTCDDRAVVELDLDPSGRRLRLGIDHLHADGVGATTFVGLLLTEISGASAATARPVWTGAGVLPRARPSERSRERARAVFRAELAGRSAELAPGGAGTSPDDPASIVNRYGRRGPRRRGRQAAHIAAVAVALAEFVPTASRVGVVVPVDCREPGGEPVVANRVGLWPLQFDADSLRRGGLEAALPAAVAGLQRLGTAIDELGRADLFHAFLADDGRLPPPWLLLASSQTALVTHLGDVSALTDLVDETRVWCVGCSTPSFWPQGASIAFLDQGDRSLVSARGAPGLPQRQLGEMVDASLRSLEDPQCWPTC